MQNDINAQKSEIDVLECKVKALTAKLEGLDWKRVAYSLDNKVELMSQDKHEIGVRAMHRTLYWVSFRASAGLALKIEKDAIDVILTVVD